MGASPYFRYSFEFLNLGGDALAGIQRRELLIEPKSIVMMDALEDDLTGMEIRLTAGGNSVEHTATSGKVLIHHADREEFSVQFDIGIGDNEDDHFTGCAIAFPRMRLALEEDSDEITWPDAGPVSGGVDAGLPESGDTQDGGTP